MANVLRLQDMLKSRVSPSLAATPDLERIGYLSSEPEIPAPEPFLPEESGAALAAPPPGMPVAAPTMPPEAVSPDGGALPLELYGDALREQRRATTLAALRDAFGEFLQGTTGAKYSGASGQSLRDKAATLMPEAEAATSEARRQALQNFLQEGGIETPGQTGLEDLRGIYGQESSNARALQALMSQQAMQQAGIGQRELDRAQRASIAEADRAARLEAARIRASGKKGRGGGAAPAISPQATLEQKPATPEEEAWAIKYTDRDIGAAREGIADPVTGRQQMSQAAQNWRQRDREFRADLEKYAALKGKVRQLDDAMGALESLKQQYESSQGDIEGVGGLRPTQGILATAVNRIAEAFGETPGKAKSNQMKLAKLRNIIIHELSGAAVTSSEAPRIMQSMAGNPLETDQEIYQFVLDSLQARQILHDTMEGAFEPEVRAAFDEKAVDKYLPSAVRDRNLAALGHRTRSASEVQQSRQPAAPPAQTPAAPAPAPAGKRVKFK